jgi:hypothetical protein
MHDHQILFINVPKILHRIQYPAFDLGKSKHNEYYIFFEKVKSMDCSILVC